MMRASLIAGAGLICLTMLAIGFGLVGPVRSAVGLRTPLGRSSVNFQQAHWVSQPAAVSAFRQPSSMALSASGARMRTRR